MKLSTECVPCLLRRAEYEVRLCAPERVSPAMKGCWKVVAEKASECISSVEFATAIHRCAYDAIGKRDPYSDLKKRSNDVALELFGEAEQFVDSSKDKFRAAMIVSTIGNVLDFGISGSLSKPEGLKKEFTRIARAPLGCDDSKEIKRIAEKSKEIFYLADNCGEIVFDRILLKEIKRLGARIVLVIKGEPILTDVTERDLRGLKIDTLVDEIVKTQGLAVGLDLWSKNRNEELKKRLRKAELIISKGMANFEGMSEYEWKAIAYLLRVKCEPVASLLGATIDTNIIKLFKGKNSER